MSNTPNCDKLSANDAERRAIANFLEWALDKKGAQLMVYLEAWSNGEPVWIDCDRHDEGAEPYLFDFTKFHRPNPAHESRPEGYYFLSGSHDDLIYEYLGIDPKALEDERRGILEAFRERQNNASQT